MLLTTLSILTLQQAPLQVVQREYCPASLIAEPEAGCKSWNANETASPLFDSERGVVYVGGLDGFLHVIAGKTQKVQQKYALPGNLVSAPVLREGYLYFGTDQGYLVCFDLEQKQIKWERKIGAEVLSSPLFDADSGYVVTGAAVLYAFAPETGEILWQKTSFSPNLPLGKPSSPLLMNDKIIWGTPSGSLEFLKTVDGSKVFDVTLGDPKKPFPEIVSGLARLEGGKIAAASFNQGVFVLDGLTGVIEWGLQSITGVTQLAAEGDVLVAAGSGFVVGIDLKKQQRVWGFKFKKGAPTPMTILEGKVYVASDLDGLYVLSLQTGQPLQILGIPGGGFAGNFDFSTQTNLFAVSTRGYLFSYARTKVSGGRRAYQARRSGTHHRTLAQQTHGAHVGVSRR